MAERAALITGGSSGIGLAIARALGEDGYGVTISARRPDKLEAAAEQLRGEGLDVQAVPAMMTDEDQIVASSTNAATSTSSRPRSSTSRSGPTCVA